MPEVELNARLEAPFERDFVDGRGALALVHRRSEVIRRVEMRAAMRRELDPLDRPAFAVGQLIDGQSRKELAYLFRGLLVIEVPDAWSVSGRISGDIVLQRDGD